MNKIKLTKTRIKNIELIKSFINCSNKKYSIEMHQILELYINKTINNIRQALNMIDKFNKMGRSPKSAVNFLNKYVNNDVIKFSNTTNKQILKLKTLNSTESLLNNIVLYEQPNIQVLNKVLNSDLLQLQNYGDKQYENEKQFLEAYRIAIKEGLIKIVYHKSALFGRVYPKMNIGAIGMRREIRGSLFYYKYFDIDIENCHPVLFLQIAKEIYNITCPNLEKYINDRKTILNEIQTFYGVDRDQAKNLIISLLYGGSFKDWAKRNNITKGITVFLKNLNEELIIIFNEIYKNNIIISEYIKETKFKSGDKLRRSTVAYYMQEIENRILETIFIYCENKNIIENIASLCYDGIMILQDKYYDNLLNEFSHDIY